MLVFRSLSLCLSNVRQVGTEQPEAVMLSPMAVVPQSQRLYHRARESQICVSCKRPLRSSGPNTNLSLPCSPLNPSIIESELLEWEKTWDHQVQGVTHHCQVHPLPTSPNTTDIHFWNTLRDGDSITAPGARFSAWPPFKWRNVRTWHNSRPFPLVLLLVTWEKIPTPTCL